MKPVVFSCKNLDVFINDKKILENISFSIKKNHNLAIMGESGSGKTTLLKVISGLITPKSGSLNIEDNIRFVMLWQTLALWPHLTVIDHLCLVKGINFKKKDLYNILERVYLLDHVEKKPENLSGGQKQRLALARSIAANPDYILLDEPFSALDLKLKISMIRLIMSMQKKFNFSIVISTHSPIEANLLSENMIFLNCGSIRYSGSIKNYAKSDICIKDHIFWFKNWSSLLKK